MPRSLWRPSSKKVESKVCPICSELVEPRKAGPHKSVHVRQAKAKYRYFGSCKHPYDFKSCVECGEKSWIQVRSDFCSYRCSKMGDRNPIRAKAYPHGMDPSEYARAHTKVNRLRGKAFGCSICKTQVDRMYHWANISGDYENPFDYWSLCVPCHDRFDRERMSKVADAA
jgi:hypothetical protein